MREIKTYIFRAKYLLISALVFGCVCCKSKNKNNDLPTDTIPKNLTDSIITADSINSIKVEEHESEKIYEIVDEMPQFPGGDNEMMKFIGENIRISKIFSDCGLQGRVVLRFVVTETGQIRNIEVLRTPDPSFSKAHVNVVKAMPRWEPGKKDGKPVPVYYILPIHIRLK